MVIGYLLVLGGAAQLAGGWRSGEAALTAMGALWLVAGLANITLSRHYRRGAAMVRAEDMTNPAARARLYQGVRGQLARGLIALICAMAALGVGIFYPFDQTIPRLLPLICGAVIGMLTVFGLLIYAASSTERAAILPATVVILGFKQLPLRGSDGQPYVRLVLDVYPDGGIRYESTVQTMIPELAAAHLQVGSQFRAQVAGPAKTAAVLIDFSSATQAGATTAAKAATEAPVAAHQPVAPPLGAPPAADRLRELEELKSQGLVTDTEYRDQRSRILDSL